ncbi:hypothetical protein DSO57_1002866 [Entomophthora muscae]|uniref:Uncharacterized protein n=1 Tax=Entomophthora muscae TaxID=34485 RepID=A0ACC2TVM3_9FUNG|nr:hypothetical protein DSO57_1002866 [Entomophthora muscae]
MQIIGFISAVLHFSLGVDASPIESSASLASLPLDTLLLQKAGQSLVLTAKAPADKGVTLNRRAGPIAMDEGDQQENDSGGMFGYIKNKPNAVSKNIKEYVKEKIHEHRGGFSKGFDALMTKGKEMLSKHTKHSQEQTGKINKEDLKLFLQALEEEEKKNPTPVNTRNKVNMIQK